jgi:ribosomal protein L12E/L44/L45/RPP1/RPP2
MAEIGRVTPGAPIVKRHPHERPAADGEKQQQNEQEQEQEQEQNENNEHDEKENHKPDHEGGVDLYV